MEHGILLTQNTLYFTFIFVSTTEYFICSDLSVRKNVLIITDYFTIIIRPQCSTTYYVCTTYVYAAYCYSGLSVCLSVTVVSTTNIAEPIEVPFRLMTRVGPRNHVLHGGPDPPREVAIFRGEGWPIVKYRDTLR